MNKVALITLAFLLCAPASAGAGGAIVGGKQRPSLIYVIPAEGQSGNEINLVGSGLGEVSRVQFGATEATSFTIHSAIWITAIVPAGSGQQPVTVTSPIATSAADFADEFAYETVTTATTTTTTSTATTTTTSVTTAAASTPSSTATTVMTTATTSAAASVRHAHRHARHRRHHGRHRHHHGGSRHRRSRRHRQRARHARSHRRIHA
ncbi:MAG: hypothetical protein ACYDA6_11320 [Solirubrobacteraceae bacterium]